jgi:hypothetical protein
MMHWIQQTLKVIISLLSLTEIYCTVWYGPYHFICRRVLAYICFQNSVPNVDGPSLLPYEIRQVLVAELNSVRFQNTKKLSKAFEDYMNSIKQFVETRIVQHLAKIRRENSLIEATDTQEVDLMNEDRMIVFQTHISVINS